MRATCADRQHENYQLVSEQTKYNYYKQLYYIYIIYIYTYRESEVYDENKMRARDGGQEPAPPLLYMCTFSKNRQSVRSIFRETKKHARDDEEQEKEVKK